MNEIWKDISGYEGLYQISNLGRVKALIRYKKCTLKNMNGGHFSKEKILKQGKRRKYLCVTLSNNNSKLNLYSAHRLVAIQFIDNPLKKQYVNHIDCNTENNKVENLEWVTAKENTQHGIKYGKIKVKGSDNPSSKLTVKQVGEIRNIYSGNRGDFTRIGKLFNVSRSCITLIIKNKTYIQ